jgi:hypothetical protein
MTAHRQRLRFIAILLVMFSGRPAVTIHAQSTEDGLPAFSKGWTDPEKSRFRECASHISDPTRENRLQLSSDSYVCVILEEEQHWMNLHPQARGKKENLTKRQKCFDKHPLQINRSPEEFHSSFDLCMCAAYGLPKPKL